MHVLNSCAILLIFTKLYLFHLQELDSEFDQCAVCIEPYKAHDVVRILPCRWVIRNSVISQLTVSVSYHTGVCLHTSLCFVHSLVVVSGNVVWELIVIRRSCFFILRIRWYSQSVRGLSFPPTLAQLIYNLLLVSLSFPGVSLLDTIFHNICLLVTDPRKDHLSLYFG